jgi:CMP-2-keto-3-deoxyoctulosonic acid synthetase
LASLESRLAVKKQHPQSLSWQKALYFTRQATGTHQHIGVYAFHRTAMHLLDLQRTALAKAEDLEQLTWLEHGHEIGVVCLKSGHLPGIDTAEDLKKARQLFQEL